MRRSRWRADVTAAAGLASLLLLALVYCLLPIARNPLLETAIWGLLVLTSFIGYGSLLQQLLAPARRVDLGLRASWGASLLCFVGGTFAAFGVMTYAAVFLLLFPGLFVAGAEIMHRRTAVWQHLRFWLRFSRREPLLVAIYVLFFAIIVLFYLGAVSDWTWSPYDDATAYVPFIKKLLETGSLIEPYSIRRLGALGGQTFFQALVAVRADEFQAFTFDRGICVLMLLLLISGHRIGGRRMPLLWTLGASVLILFIPNHSPNTASSFSAAMALLALFRTLCWLSEGRTNADLRSRLLPAVLLALVGAMACTLRQFLMAPVALTLALSYVFVAARLRVSWLERIREPAGCLGLSLLFLLPWFIHSYQSNQTFLFPLIEGTFNPAMKLHSDATSGFMDVRLLAMVLINGPIQSLPLLVLAAALVRDTLARKPLWSAVAGNAIGIVLTVILFSGSEQFALNRYVFWQMLTIGIISILWVAPLALAWNGRLGTRSLSACVLVVLALGIQITRDLPNSTSTVHTLFTNIDILFQSERSPRAEEAFYRRAQANVPAGESIAIAIDQPYYLSYSRNPIFNLDLPGYASPHPGMPMFQGWRKLKDYFLGQGIRYLLFVKPEYSPHMYRPQLWQNHLVSDMELWRTTAPFTLDFFDSMLKMQKETRVLFEERGVVLLDLRGEAAEP